MNENFDEAWWQNQYEIVYSIMHTWEFWTPEVLSENKIEYDSSKELLEQSEETLQQIITLITNNS